jgi:hypothetical protein
LKKNAKFAKDGYLTAGIINEEEKESEKKKEIDKDCTETENDLSEFSVFNSSKTNNVSL